ncbi:MAG: ABC transporter substrate-binding protein [Gemmatimonadaceae bacterium]|nr:ABC transporter substrate-binding protein [Gemmatimonadaceae bacterium]
MPFLRSRRVGALLAACSLVACTKPAPPILRIGLIGIFEGTAKDASGIPAQRGAQLAVEELNAAGGVNIGGVRHLVRLTERQIEPRTDAAAAAARNLINIDSVDVVIGPQFSNLAIAAGAVAEAASVPLIAPMASSPTVTADRQFVTRLAFVDAQQGEVLARFAYDSLKVRRAAALFNVASGYGREIVRLFSSTFSIVGGTFTDSVTFNSDAPEELNTALRRVLAGRPDAILLPNFVSKDSMQPRLLRAMGYTGRFLGSDGWDATAIKDRSALVGVIIVGNFDKRDARPALAAFSARWRQRYPNDMLRATAAATYDAVKIVADAALAAGTTEGTALAMAIRAPRTFEGALATYRFNGSGDPIRGAVLLEVRADSAILRATATATR